MQCFLVGAVNDGVRVELASLMQERGSTFAVVPSLGELRTNAHFAESFRPLVVFPETDAFPMNVDDVIEFTKEQGGRTFVVCLADAMQSNDYKRLVRTGTAEWIAWQDHRHEFGELLARLDAANASDRTAAVLSFLPSKGGVGNTTLVTEVATYLANRRKRTSARVAILDLNLQGGTVADTLDIEPRFAITEIVDRPERLDEQLVDIFTSRHSKNLDVFASPLSRLLPHVIKPDIIFAFIDTVASRYDAILFDLPAQWLSWTDDLLRGSDAVIVSGGERVPALRKLGAVLNHIDALGISDTKVATVVNRVDADLLGRISRRNLVERALPKRRTFYVREDRSNLGNASDVGRPLLDLVPNSRVSRDIKRLAEWVETLANHTQIPNHKTAHSRGATA